MEVIHLNESHIDLVKEFCNSAKSVGYYNNSSIELMKFNGTYDLGEVANFWAIVKDNKIISVSGCHRWKDLDGNPTIMRCLFRSATLPEYSNIVPGLSRNHMNSLPFSVMLPLQIKLGIDIGVKNFYITTSNGDHDASGKMKRTHKALQLLEKSGIVKNLGDEIFYSTSQTKWEINLDEYFDALRKFHPTRVQIGIELTEEYLDIINNGFNCI